MQLAMAVPSLEELDSFKYSDLQNLAKNLGLRANLRADKLLKALKAHLKHKVKKENDNRVMKIQRYLQKERSLSTQMGFPNLEKAKEIQALLQDSAQPEVTPNSVTIAIQVPGTALPTWQKQLVTKGMVVTPVPLRGRLPAACTPTSQRRSQGQPLGTAGRSTLCGKGSAKRSVLSATKMNVRFSAATKDNEHKRSLTKTPARKSPHVTIPGNTPEGQAVLGTDKLKTTNGNSASVVTPFKLTTQAVQTPVSNKKPVFDLKASLSRPLNYEPHKGKLKPWGQSKENNSLKEHVNRVSFHKKTYKQPPLQTREEKRKQHEQRRKEKKAKVLGARRGLIMAED
ncbi:hypothetical protein GH733_004237 [Mirounga leonina]|nr:hypothetical protein GH733_004237 [Mirounga leonina]